MYERLLDEAGARIVRKTGKHHILQLKNGHRVPLLTKRNMGDPRSVRNACSEIKRLMALPADKPARART